MKVDIYKRIKTLENWRNWTIYKQNINLNCNFLGAVLEYEYVQKGVSITEMMYIDNARNIVLDNDDLIKLQKEEQE